VGFFFVGELSTKIANSVSSSLSMTSSSTSTGNLSSLPDNVDSSGDTVAGQHNKMFLLVTICAIAIAVVVVLALVWIVVKGRRRRTTESDEERSVQRCALSECVFLFSSFSCVPSSNRGGIIHFIYLFMMKSYKNTQNNTKKNKK